MQVKVPVPISSAANSPQIEVRKVGNVVESICVACNCGNIVNIKCEYSKESDPKPGNQ